VNSAQSKPRLLLIGLVFLISRAVLLPFPQPASDISIYAPYVQEYEAARRKGVPFYQWHAQTIDRQIAEARVSGQLSGSIDEYKNVEYPPFALLVMAVPRLWMQATAVPDAMTPEFLEKYQWAFRLGMFVVDISVLAVLAWLVQSLYQDEAGRDRTLRLLVYLASTILLWHLLYDRLDLLLALMLLLSMILLFSRCHYAWSFAVLAAAINFKLIPVVLAPAWILGSMPAGRRLDLMQPSVLFRLCWRSALLGGLVVACFLPFYLTAGAPSVGFLAYHRARGIEIGSLFSALVLALQAFGHQIRVDYSYGSVNVHSSLSELLARCSPFLAGTLLLAATALLLVRFAGLTRKAGAEDKDKRRLAQVYPRVVVSYSLLFLMIFIATNKVFSPQYLLWLAPLVALLPFTGRTRQGFTWGFLTVCLLSTVLVPFLYAFDLIDSSAPQTVPRLIREPTTRLAVVVIVRNVLFLILTTWLGLRLYNERGNDRRQSTTEA
jgi:hypothetical protein